ncbi:MAG: hypothetical protein HQK84_11275 [Nitrospinae bacterium]|nr:hypothetical protein [Nitrospinota bacterium]
MFDFVTEKMVRWSIIGAVAGTLLGGVIGVLCGTIGLVETQTASGNVYSANNAMKGLSMGMAFGLPMGVCFGTVAALIDRFSPPEKKEEKDKKND